MTTDPNAGGQGGGDGGSQVVAPDVSAWLPGVDADTAKFITDATIKDLPSLAKTFVEQKRALSQPRGFEMPKEGDTEGLKKMHAALGIPEAPDKYDLGEPGKAMAEDARKFWTGELHKMGIPNKAAQGLVGLVASQAAAYQTQQDEAFAAQSVKETDSKMSEWGDSSAQNKDLATRGIGKLFENLKMENNLENRTKLERAFGTGKFLDLALLLGRNMVEAGFVTQDGQRRGLSKEGAAQELQAMMTDGNLRAALTSKTHPDHQKALARKIELENIAHS